MDCGPLSYDNRETCVNPVPSSCIPYTGYIAESLKGVDIPECKPNINDLIKAISNKIDTIIEGLGDNTTLDPKCIGFDETYGSQAELNQQFINELCALKTAFEALPSTVDPTTIEVAVDLLCLEDPSCDPQTTYSLLVVLQKLLTNHCNLLARVEAIEAILNI